jgi:hypothetical protein
MTVSGELEVQLRRYAGAAAGAKGTAQEALSVYNFFVRLSEVLEALNIVSVEELELDDESVLEAPQNIREVLRDLFWRKDIGEAVDVNLTVFGSVEGKDYKLLVEYHRLHPANEPGFVIEAEVLAENFETPEAAEGFVNEFLKRIDAELRRSFSIGESGTVKIREADSEQGEDDDDEEAEEEEENGEDEDEDEDEDVDEEKGRKSPWATILGFIVNLIALLIFMRSCSN